MCSIVSVAPTSGNVLFKVRSYDIKPVPIKLNINEKQSQAWHVSS